MTTDTLTLTDFLLARIAEDEADAREAAADVGAERWFAEYCEDGTAWVDVSPRNGVPYEITGARPSHIARHDPARVLAECEAKRRIVATRPMEVLSANPQAWRVRDHVIRLLALPYADHPDYRQEWKP